MLRSLGFGLGLETCQIFDDFGFGFKKFGIGKKVSVSFSENLVSEKKSRYRLRKIWYRKKSLRIGFGQIFGIVIQWEQVHLDQSIMWRLKLSVLENDTKTNALCFFWPIFIF